MSRSFLSIFAIVCALCPCAEAGWLMEWAHTTNGTSGKTASSEVATTYIAGNRMRTEQPTIVSITDYKKQRIALLDPARQQFWSGTLDEYVMTVTRDRGTILQDQMGTQSPPKKGQSDPEKLPVITIEKLDDTQMIAGRLTRKHEIRANGEAFQDLWMAEDLQVSTDLDPKLFLSYQRKMSETMLGKSAGDYDALYQSDQYRKLLENGFALKTLTRHIAGSFERTATSVRAAEIPPDTFEVPAEYRRVRLEDVFPK